MKALLCEMLNLHFLDCKINLYLLHFKKHTAYIIVGEANLFKKQIFFLKR